VSHLLAIDLGTGSCRAVLFGEEGNQVAIGQREWGHAQAPGVPGSQVFDTERNWQLICDCTKEALARGRVPASEVRAVSATSMREGIVLYDAAGRATWACPNVDSRASAEAAELVRSGRAEQIYRLAGDWVSITSVARLEWVRIHQPEVFSTVAHLTMLSDWALYKLSGEFVTDPSVGSSSGMFDLARRTWSPDIVEWSGLPVKAFPKVRAPGTVIGAVTARTARETGLQEGTPVVVGGADTQLGLVGIGVTKPDRATIVGGSFWQQTLVLSSPLIDPEARLRTLCHAVSDQWMIEGIGFYSGMTMRWFRDAFCDAERGEADRRGVDAYVVMEEEAAKVPVGSNGVLGIFSNLMCAKRWVHASPAFVQFDITNPARSGRKECIRAIEESAAYVSYGHLNILQELTGLRFDEIVFTGGAAKGALWPQILADVLGVPVKVPVVKESTSLGAAMYAGVGVGMYRNLDDVVAHVVRFDRTYAPDAAAHQTYEQRYAEWRTAYGRLLDLSEEGVLLPMWRAAGT
jgi:autoinducer 2 (AI-2) kinase